jgi:hypothetical protein
MTKKIICTITGMGTKPAPAPIKKESARQPKKKNRKGRRVIIVGDKAFIREPKQAQKENSDDGNKLTA